jgi:hypothetical protein
VKPHTNGTLILARLGKVSLGHPETMIPRGRVDEITKEPKTNAKRVTPEIPAAVRVWGVSCRVEWSTLLKLRNIRGDLATDFQDEQMVITPAAAQNTNLEAPPQAKTSKPCFMPMWKKKSSRVA